MESQIKFIPSAQSTIKVSLTTLLQILQELQVDPSIRTNKERLSIRSNLSKNDD